MIITDEIKHKIAAANQANPYVDVTPYELGMGLPLVSYMGFHPQVDEVLIYAAPAATFKDKEQIVGYSGKSTGVSVRVAKGVTIRTGSTGSNAVRATTRQSYMGDLLITNKRIIFVGKDDSFEFYVDKISTVKLLSKNSFVVQAGRSSKNLWLDSAIVAYAYGLINYSINENAAGTDVCAAIQNDRRNLTPQQLALCNQVSQECSKMKMPKPKGSQGCLWGIAKFLLILLGLVLVGGIIAIIVLTSGNNLPKENNVKYSYTEILALDNQPNVFERYDDTKAFYKEIDAVKVLTIQQKGQIERSLKNTTDDDVLLYFIKHSTNEEFTGTVQLNLYDQSVCTDITVESAAKLLVTYLPDSFFDYYTKDSSYKYSGNGRTVYVYSCRVNELGNAYRNDGHSEYPYYYSFTLVHFEDTNQWKLETDYAAYGGKGLEWIEKYSDEWNVDFKDYVE